MNFIVTKKAMRPNSTKDECFYCHKPIGGLHKPDCVLINKNVKIRAVLEYNVDVPNFWTAHDIEFHRNDSSWCSSNIIGELERLSKKDCLCRRVRFECLDDKGDAFLSEE